MSKSSKFVEFGDKEKEKTWTIDQHGVVTVDVHKLLRRPKARRQIAKAREIMERIRREQEADR